MFLDCQGSAMMAGTGQAVQRVSYISVGLVTVCSDDHRDRCISLNKHTSTFKLSINEIDKAHATAVGQSGRNHGPYFDVSCLGIEILAEAHDVQACLPKCRAHGWRGLCLPSIDDELDCSCYCFGLLGHAKAQTYISAADCAPTLTPSLTVACWSAGARLRQCNFLALLNHEEVCSRMSAMHSSAATEALPGTRPHDIRFLPEQQTWPGGCKDIIPFAVVWAAAERRSSCLRSAETLCVSASMVSARSWALLCPDV